MRRRFYIALVISLIPSRLVRILLYRSMLRYRISLRAKIHFGVVIAVPRATIGAAEIMKFNRFEGLFELVVEDGAIVGPFCNVDNGDWILELRQLKADRLPSCTIREGSRITATNYIDVSDDFELGEASWIAGRGSCFWTHGAGIVGKCIIGSHCYVGSGVQFAPGTRVGNHSVVALGSVVTEQFDREYVMIAGMPARIIKENYDWSKHGPAS